MKKLVLFLCVTLPLLYFSCGEKSRTFGDPQESKDSIKSPEPVKPKRQIEVQGHRGCRGLMPENTLPAFKKALDLGVRSLELDVVITRDKKVLVSHEPWLSHEICTDKRGREIKEAQEPNIYKMTYEEIARCDCGSIPHPRFPKQKKIQVSKPLLNDLIDSLRQYCRDKDIDHNTVWYNIEIKRKKEHDRIFHPPVAEFTDLLISLIQDKNIGEQCNIQSFDWEVLRLCREKAPHIPLAMLVENELSAEENLQELGFTPQIYSCYFKLIDKEVLDFVEKYNMKLIPWTVNEPNDIETMLALPIDGIITDFPDRVFKALE